MSSTYYLVAAIVFFVLAVVIIVLGIRAIMTGKTIYSRYNRMRDSLPESEQKKRDKLIGISNIVEGIAAVAFGVSAFYQFDGIFHWIGLILLVPGIILSNSATKDFE